MIRVLLVSATLLAGCSTLERTADSVNRSPFFPANWRIAPDAPPPLPKGAKLTLEYREEPIFWVNRWFSISGAGFPSMNFGGISADHLAPPGTTTDSFFSVGLDVQGGVCAPIDDDLCGPEERLALEVAFGVESRVLDGQFRSFFDLPGYVSLWVQTARRPVEPVQCDDVPPAWFQLLMTSEFGP